MENSYQLIPFLPLIGAIIAGFFGKQIGRAGAHWVTILGVGAACVMSIMVLAGYVTGEAEVIDEVLYTWASVGDLKFQVGFLVDSLTAMMMVVVTFVSLMVHIYTIGYMHDDPGYQRFFAYISLFTFSMLMLVMSNNFLQLFFGWEAVGLVSYLLIGFWYKKETAIFANMKAFLVNRVGDFGFLLGIAGVLAIFGTMHYGEVFDSLDKLEGETFLGASAITFICIGLFIGAMGKSAQVPLHVWLPDSMEGPTPISALIHAATMVTAGIFMVARMSPLYELSETALSFVMIIGATTALFMGFVGIVQNDIKRVVAYSTLSQLGYMITALGASAYAAGVFHLMTHAFFKALLFLAAGSVIVALHHKQDMREMGGLKKYMPITWITSLVGSLALIGFPGFSGFFSKDAIIMAVGASEITGSTYALWCLIIGVFVTAFYSFRMYYLVFHGKTRMDKHTEEHAHECSWVVTVPLILLAIPSVFIGAFAIEPMLFGSFFDGVIFVDEAHKSGLEWHGVWSFVLHGFAPTSPVWLALIGTALAIILYAKNERFDDVLRKVLGPVYGLLEQKYFMDHLYINGFAGAGKVIGRIFWKVGDVVAIDGLLVNGSAKLVGAIAGAIRGLQTGYLYHYAAAMIIGLVVLLGVFVL